MILIFRRTGHRRYTVAAQRNPFPDLEMDPAPGFDPLMPHDMMHAVVEAKLGLTRAVFGQLAAGGDAGTFRTMVNQEKSREVARLRRRVKAKGKTLMREGQDESAQSERAAAICWNVWQARGQSKTKSAAPPDISERKLDEICRHLDELSSHWSSLKIGEAMAISWPDLSVTRL